MLSGTPFFGGLGEPASPSGHPWGSQSPWGGSWHHGAVTAGPADRLRGGARGVMDGGSRPPRP